MDQYSKLSQASFAWMQEIYKYSLTDLGSSGNAALDGIYTPTYSQEEVDRFMSNYYASDEGARRQQENYGLDMVPYYHANILEAVTKANYDLNKPSIILELGCGFGSATIPILQLFPNARLIASELSIPMLSILKEFMLKQDVNKNHVFMQLNAEEMDFIPNSLDMVIGAAILHHLFTPEKVIEQCYKILKPGGIAIFFEPFEAGCAILSLIYKSILKENKLRLWNRLNTSQSNYLKGCIDFWRQMKNLDKANPFFVGVDDKWLFTRQYFGRLVDKYGFKKCDIYPINKIEKPFSSLVKVHSRGNNVTLPDWVWPIVDEYEDNFSIDLKEDILTEGTVIFIK
jgi:ubiquinone/menaquinone biosynthesis C-methylase UbiE